MPPTRLLALSIGVALLVASSVGAAEVPDTPNGFSWKQVPQIKAAFVVPDGWHFLEETKGKTLEEIEDHFAGKTAKP